MRLTTSLGSMLILLLSLAACESPIDVEANRRRTLLNSYTLLPSKAATAEINYICTLREDFVVNIELELQEQQLRDFEINSLQVFSPKYPASIEAIQSPLIFDSNSALKFRALLTMEGRNASKRINEPISLIINDTYRQDIVVDMAPDTILVRRDRGSDQEVAVGTTAYPYITTWNVCIEDFQLEFFELDDPGGALTLHDFKPISTLEGGEIWGFFLNFTPTRPGKYEATVTIDFSTDFGSTIRFFYDVTVYGK